jgi:hypothetical protein
MKSILDAVRLSPVGAAARLALLLSVSLGAGASGAFA